MSSEPPVKENRRLDALHRYQILDTEPEEVFDDIVKLAAAVCGTPIALMSFIDHDRMWVKSNRGFPREEISRRDSFCTHAIESTGVFEVPDAARDPRFASNKFVVEPPSIRFYAGVPLETLDGHAVGTLCVMGDKPHFLTAEQRVALETLARHAVRELDSRMRAIELAESLRTHEKTLCDLAASELRYREVLAHATDVIYTHTIAGDFTSINRAGSELCGYSVDEILRMNIRDIVAPEMIDRALKAIASKVFEDSAATRYELEVIHRNGTRIPLEVNTRVIYHGGRPVEIVGVGRVRSA